MSALAPFLNKIFVYKGTVFYHVRWCFRPEQWTSYFNLYLALHLSDPNILNCHFNVKLLTDLPHFAPSRMPSSIRHWIFYLQLDYSFDLKTGSIIRLFQVELLWREDLKIGAKEYDCTSRGEEGVVSSLKLNLTDPCRTVGTMIEGCQAGGLGHLLQYCMREYNAESQKQGRKRLISTVKTIGFDHLVIIYLW